MTAGTITGGEQVIAKINGYGRELRPRVARIITEFAIDVTAAAKRKVSGDVLKVRTGRLRRSIHYEVTDTSGTVGTNVEYARALELGFKGQVSIRSFVRQQVTAFGRPIAPISVNVRAHSRNVDMPPRPFLAPALAETKPTLAERLRADLRAMAGGS